MDYSDPSSVPWFRPPADQLDPLLTELQEVHIVLGIAEHHIRLWRANVAMADVSFRPRLSYVAHEALYEASKSINRIAELLKVQANGTLATQQGSPAALYYPEAPPTSVAEC